MLQNKESIKTISNELGLDLTKEEVIALDNVLDDIELDNLNDILTFIRETESENEYLEVIEKLDNELNNSNDFFIEVNNKEYRFIHNDDIEDLFYDYNVNLIDECYFTNDTPEVLKNYFDYDKFVSDCMYNGYANTFSSYDGTTEIKLNSYRVFRTN